MPVAALFVGCCQGTTCPDIVRMLDDGMAIGHGKSERIDVRTSRSTKALLQRAAASSHKNVSEFLLAAGIAAAEESLMNRRLFRLDDAQWRAFQEALDRPVIKKVRLARLLSKKSILE
jgi:uncharacterized protein (DUF1778 family)